jgi:hypothetical protein
VAWAAAALAVVARVMVAEGMEKAVGEQVAVERG